jgi:hypothetical protein
MTPGLPLLAPSRHRLPFGSNEAKFAASKKEMRTPVSFTLEPPTDLGGTLSALSTSTGFRWLITMALHGFYTNLLGRARPTSWAFDLDLLYHDAPRADGPALVAPFDEKEIRAAV